LDDTLAGGIRHETEGVIGWPSPVDPQESAAEPGRIPSLLQVLAIWLSAVAAVLVASTAVTIVATLARGIPLDRLLADLESSPMLTSPAWIALGTAANELVLAAVLATWLWAIKPNWGRVLPLVRPPPLSLLAALPIVFGLTPFAAAAGHLAERFVPRDITAAQIVAAAARNAGTAEFLVLLASVSLLPAIVEEAVFRGAITAAFARRSFVSALVVPSLLFGLLHIDPKQVAGTTVLGLGFGLLRLATGSLIPCMLAHGAYNAAVLVAVRYSVDEGPGDGVSLAPLVTGALALGFGLWLLRRAGLDKLSSRATARTPVPPPA
jgi:membrane protease YdiL (CAAX protease family)